MFISTVFVLRMDLADILKAAITKSGKEHGYPLTQIDIKHGYFVDDAGDNVGSMTVTVPIVLRELVETAAMLVVSGVEPRPTSLTRVVGGGKVVICITWTEESPLAKAHSMWKSQQSQRDAVLADAQYQADTESAQELSDRLNYGGGGGSGRVGAGAVVRGGLGRGAVAHGGSGRGAVVRGGSGRGDVVRGGGSHGSRFSTADAMTDAQLAIWLQTYSRSSEEHLKALRRLPF